MMCVKIGAGFHQPDPKASPAPEIDLAVPQELHPGSVLRPQSSATIGLRSRPTPSISISQTSPGFIHSGGLRTQPTPPGVPETITSPGESGVKLEKYSISLFGP